MPISEIERRKAEKTLREYCQRKTNPAVIDQLEVVYRFEGNAAYIAERRPNWRDPSAEKIDYDIAKFRFVVKDRQWKLHCMRRDLKWHSHIFVEPSADIADLLPEVDGDPIFFG